MRVGAGRECCDLFVAYVDPVYGAVSAQRIGEAVERVAGQAVDTLDTCVLQGFYQQFCDRLCHDVSSDSAAVIVGARVSGEKTNPVNLRCNDYETSSVNSRRRLGHAR